MDFLSKKTYPLLSQSLSIAAVMVFLMLLTRGSHVLTHVSLPDASLAIFLLAGLYLRNVIWFVLLVVLATVIDFGAAAIDSIQAFCLTDGYWGMLPTYAVMWFAGAWLHKQENTIEFTKLMFAGFVSTLLAFMISTQTYYLFSGRFPAKGIMVSLQHGWEYFPSYSGFTIAYLVAFWVLMKCLSKFNIVNKVTSHVA